MAFDHMSILFIVVRHLGLASLGTPHTTRVELAALRELRGVWHQAIDGLQPILRSREAGNGIKEALGVWMMVIAVEKILKKQPMILGPGVKTGLNIVLDNPGEMGADRVADAVAALAQYPVPLVIVDMGTATTISVLDDRKRYIGGMIMPGVRISLDALTSRASQLSGISIEEPKRLIGRNTVDCMKSGILYGNAAAVDGIVDRIEEELGQKVTVIATGGMSRKIIPHCKREMILDCDLLLKGLQVIYDKNK